MISGDKNTKYFHASVKAERSRNGLDSLLDEDGILNRSEASKRDVSCRYFQKLFTSLILQNLKVFLKISSLEFLLRQMIF